MDFSKADHVSSDGTILGTIMATCKISQWQNTSRLVTKSCFLQLRHPTKGRRVKLCDMAGSVSLQLPGYNNVRNAVISAWPGCCLPHHSFEVCVEDDPSPHEERHQKNAGRLQDTGGGPQKVE